MTEKLFPWKEGQPTKPDVDALLKAFPPESIAQGEWTVTDEQVAEIIGTQDEVRRRTITDTWRKALRRDFNKAVFRQKNAGFYCPNFAHVKARANTILGEMRTKSRGQMRVIAATRPENDSERSELEHQGRLFYTLNRELKKTRAALTPPGPTPMRPQIQAPRPPSL